MPLSLPRALSPLRFFVVFLVLFCLLFFRSYYLPTPAEGSSYHRLTSAANSWLPGSSSSSVEDVQLDPDFEHEFTDLDEAEFTDPLSIFPDHSRSVSLDAPTATSAADSTPSPSSAESSAKETSTASSTPSDVEFTPDNIPLCRQLPGADKVVVMIKTGATEVQARIPGLLLSFEHCMPNLMFFSDMEQDIGKYHIYDALDEVAQEWKDSHEDFKFYRDLQQNFAAHGDVSRLDPEKAWNLDKWKNIPMVHKAYTQYPDADWYVTLDADTYLGWTNLLMLLSHLDPDEPLYAGCVYWHSDTAFAQGGTGYLLSRNAVQKFEEIRTPKKINDWETETSFSCCGDVMMSIAMGHAGIPVTGAWPMFQVDPPSLFEWYSDDYWCKPAITWHHSRPYEVEGLWQFEMDWINKTWDDKEGGAKPYLFADAFENFILPHLAERRDNWDNSCLNKEFMKPPEGDDAEIEGKKINEEQKNELEDRWKEYSETEQKSTESVDDCEAACEEDGECYQWSWKPGICRLHHSIRMGNAASPKHEVVSGWRLHRVEKFLKSRENCTEVKWDLS